MEIEYWIRPHEHSVRLRQETIDNEQLSCKICDSSTVKGSPFYFCDSCTGFCVHKSCVGLPYQIKHPFHSHPLLTLFHHQSNWCDCCFEDFEDEPSYYCGVCPYIFDSKCALMPLVTSGSKGQDWIKHFRHLHPLLRVHDDQRIKCFVCKSTSNQDLYGCSKCEYFLHKSCAHQSLRKVHLPIHRNHRDALTQQVTNPFSCRMCGIRLEDRFNLGYECNQCSLLVCFKCAEVAWRSRGSINYEDHNHLLCLVHNVHKDDTTITRCHAYDSYCSQRVVTSSDEFKKMEPFMLWCYECGFKVHLLCAPLPSMVKHEFHIHPLTLVDSMREDDSGEYYCDACETKRDPMIRLYCCQDCKYFAHVHCLLPEIVKVLSGDLRDVELRLVGQDLVNAPNTQITLEHVDSSLTLKDVINELSEEEKKNLRLYYKWEETSEERYNIESNKVGDEEIDEILQFSHFVDEDFRSFWSNLDHFYGRNKLELKPSDLASKIAKVKDYMIPHSLAAILNKLLHEYGDTDVAFASKSLGFKSFVLFIACKVVKSMQSTMPICITKNLLQEWYYHLAFAAVFNFRVDFAITQLKGLVHAFLGFQAQRLEEEIPTMLKKKIDDLQQKLDECNKIRGSCVNTEYKKYCLNKASEFKWKTNALEYSFTQKMSTESSKWDDVDDASLL